MCPSVGVQTPLESNHFLFIPSSEVVIFLLNVTVHVLEAERLDVVGNVSDATVEFLRS